MLTLAPAPELALPIQHTRDPGHPLLSAGISLEDRLDRRASPLLGLGQLLEESRHAGADWNAKRQIAVGSQPSGIDFCLEALWIQVL